MRHWNGKKKPGSRNVRPPGIHVLDSGAWAIDGVEAPLPVPLMRPSACDHFAAGRRPNAARSALSNTRLGTPLRAAKIIARPSSSVVMTPLGQIH